MSYEVPSKERDERLLRKQISENRDLIRFTPIATNNDTSAIGAGSHDGSFGSVLGSLVLVPQYHYESIKIEWSGGTGTVKIGEIIQTTANNWEGRLLYIVSGDSSAGIGIFEPTWLNEVTQTPRSAFTETTQTLSNSNWSASYTTSSLDTGYIVTLSASILIDKMEGGNPTIKSIYGAKNDGQFTTVKPKSGKTLTLSTGDNLDILSNVTVEDSEIAILQYHEDRSNKWVLLSGSGGGSSAVKLPVKAVSVGNNSFHPLYTSPIDGITMNVGDRFLVKDQSTQKDNGIYVYGTGLLGVSERATDMPHGSTVEGGTVVYSNEGNTYEDNLFVLVNYSNVVVGTDSQIWEPIGGSGVSIPSGSTENEHLEWDNTALSWNAVQSLTFGATGNFADSGFLRFANDQIVLSGRNSGNTGNVEVKLTDLVDITESNNGSIGLQVRSQHSTNPDSTFYVTQSPDITGTGGTTLLGSLNTSSFAIELNTNSMISMVTSPSPSISVLEKIRMNTNEIYLDVDHDSAIFSYVDDIIQFATNNIIRMALSNSQLEMGITLNMNNNDITMGTGEISAGGATKEINNIGELVFVNNTLTPAGNGIIYFDGTDLKAKTGSTTVNLTNIGGANFTDAVFRVTDELDLTKKFAVDVTGNSTGVVTTLDFNASSARTYSFPDVTGTVITDTGSQTISGSKTFSNNIIAGGAGDGMTNIGHLDFIDNLATPVSGLSIYSDGTSLIANTNSAVGNLVITPAMETLDMNYNIIDNIQNLISGITNPASVGFMRLGNSEQISWRNAGNTADYYIKLDGLNTFEINAPIVPDSGGTLSIGTSSIRFGTGWFTNVDANNLLSCTLDGSNHLDGTAVISALDYNLGLRQTFRPNGTNSGFNVGSNSSDPSSPLNGDIIYNTTSNTFRFRQNGSWEELGGGISDKIEEGDSRVEVVDSGTGDIAFYIDSSVTAKANMSASIFNLTYLDLYMYNNKIDGVGKLDFGTGSAITANQTEITDISNNLTYNVPTGKGHLFKINDQQKLGIGSSAIYAHTNIDLQTSNYIFNSPDPVNNQDVANKQWVLANAGGVTQESQIFTANGSLTNYYDHWQSTGMNNGVNYLSGGGRTLTYDTRYFIPFYLSKSATLKNIGNFAKSSPSGIYGITFAVYNNATNGELYPNSRLYQSSVSYFSSSALGLRKTTDFTLALSSGLYWIAFNQTTNNTNEDYYCDDDGNATVVGWGRTSSSSITPEPITGYYESSTSSSFPTTASSGMDSLVVKFSGAVSAPKMFLRFLP